MKKKQRNLQTIPVWKTHVNVNNDFLEEEI